MKIVKPLSFAVLLFLTQQTGYTQSCILRCPPNMLATADSGREGAIVILPEASGTGCSAITYSRRSGTFFRFGSHSIIAMSASGEKCSFTVTVTDNESPVLSPLSLSVDRLWPASNKMRKVRVNYTVTDNAQKVTSVVSVSSNDTVSANIDWQVVNDHLVLLKGSRLPNGEPRIYLITVTSSDEAGNKMSRTTSIAVSKTMIALKPKDGN